MPARYQTVLLFGAPGAGKGTQGAMLGRVPGFHHLSSGDVFRTLDPHSELGKTFYQYSSRGELVPDELTVKVLAENMHAQTVLSIFKPHDDILVLDGIPRTRNQAELMQEHCDVLGVIHLVCPDKDAMMERLRKRAIKEKRADDAKEDVIRRRWEIYEEDTAPVLDFYDSSIVREVDAMGSPGKVLQQVLEQVVPIQEAHFNNSLA